MLQESFYYSSFIYETTTARTKIHFNTISYTYFQYTFLRKNKKKNQTECYERVKSTDDKFFNEPPQGDYEHCSFLLNVSYNAAKKEIENETKKRELHGKKSENVNCALLAE